MFPKTLKYILLSFLAFSIVSCIYLFRVSDKPEINIDVQALNLDARAKLSELERIKENYSSIKELEDICASISPDAYVSGLGLAFNPYGLKSYYYQSVCYSKVAVLSGQESLCEKVRTYKSYLWNGSWYSEENCLKRVEEQRGFYSPNGLSEDGKIRSPYSVCSVNSRYGDDQTYFLSTVILCNMPQNVAPINGMYNFTLFAPDSTTGEYFEIKTIPLHIANLSPELKEINFQVSVSEIEKAGGRKFDLEYLNIRAEVSLVKEDL